MRTLEKQGQLHFEDTAVIERSLDGKIQVKNEVSGATEGGAVVGAVIGGFVTFMFPLAGAAIGGAVGGAIGSLMHTGVSAEFVEEIEASWSPGKSALFLVVKEATPARSSRRSAATRARSSRRRCRRQRSTSVEERACLIGSVNPRSGG